MHLVTIVLFLIHMVAQQRPSPQAQQAIIDGHFSLLDFAKGDGFAAQPPLPCMRILFMRATNQRHSSDVFVGEAVLDLEGAPCLTMSAIGWRFVV